MLVLVFIGILLVGIAPVWADNDTSQAYGGSGINFLLKDGLAETAFDCDPIKDSDCYALNQKNCLNSELTITLAANFTSSTIDCDNTNYRKIWLSTDSSCQDTTTTTYLSTKYNLNKTDTESGIYLICDNDVDYYPNSNLKESEFTSTILFEQAGENSSCSAGIEQTLYLCYAIGPNDGGSSSSNIVYGWHKFKIDTKVPAIPTATVEPGDGQVTVNYSGSDSDIYKAIVYYREVADSNSDDCLAWSSPKTAIYSGNKTSGSITIEGLDNGKDYQYCVVVMDDQGNVSDPTPVAKFGAVDECDFWECAPSELGSGGFCFVATAAYGADDPVLEVLRRFRDTVLMNSNPGRWFIYTYYRLSPPLAQAIAASPVLRVVTRILLTPVQLMAQLIMLARGHLVAFMAGLLALLALTLLGVGTIRRRHEA